MNDGVKVVVKERPTQPVEELPVAVALPVSPSSTSSPAMATATAASSAPPRAPPVVVAGVGGYADMGTCRRCGVRFVRTPDISDSTARFYRCERCSQLRVDDFCTVA